MANRTCKLEGCGAPHSARGYCNNHWYRWRHGLDMNGRMKVRRTAADVLFRDEQGRKQCVRCLAWFAESQFSGYTRSPDGLYSYCVGCVAIKNRMHRLKAQYGLTETAFVALLAAQNGGCAICGTEIGMMTCHVDHDHACCEHHRNTCGNCVRGLLCPGCNFGIAAFRDSTDRLRAAIHYLDSRQLTLPVAI